ncbi:uncharacterized protein EDB91DRAFT_1250497 [Suillus paluster]|uniref:uncharacterized protein n=1 Tax=Suillus paluster TaxID=48578 RepID=UPI001B86265A|nr:uncharacterized protein EDB91DRAFT_1250497 [Suillus paluster]KAG1735283.1 hypothetical protein EDB91DRAFT_1250497 [Suillus paluster]
MSIEQLLQNLQISGSRSTKSRQIDIRCPPVQRYEQHYGYRLNRRYLLNLESKIKTNPNAFHYPLTLARKWIQHTLQLPIFEFKYCIDPERREIEEVPADEDVHYQDEDRDEDENDEDDEVVIVVLAVCSDDPDSFDARPTEEQMTLLTNLLGDAPQWWVSYKNM